MLPVEKTRAGNGRRHARTVVLPWPTTTGLAMVVAFLAGWRMSSSTIVAIGFFVPLLGLMILDYGFSALTIRHRPVSINVVRRHAESPNEKLTFTATAPAGQAALRLLIRRVGPLSEDGDFVTLQPDETSTGLALDSHIARAGHHVRYRVDVTFLGLVWARRWETQETAETYIAPGPGTAVHTSPLAADELSHIREYVPGDRMSRVSWTTTARTGQLHVRAESLGDDEITVVLNLGPNYNDVDGSRAALSNCATVVTELLAQGRTVRLVTASIVPKLFLDELEAALTTPSLTPRAALKVTAGVMPELDGQPAVHLLSEVVTDRLHLNRRLAYAEHHPAMPMPSGPHLAVTAEGVTHVR